MVNICPQNEDRVYKWCTLLPQDMSCWAPSEIQECPQTISKIDQSNSTSLLMHCHFLNGSHRSTLQCLIINDDLGQLCYSLSHKAKKKKRAYIQSWYKPFFNPFSSRVIKDKIKHDIDKQNWYSVHLGVINSLKIHGHTSFFFLFFFTILRI